MGSAGLHLSRSNTYDPEDIDPDDAGQEDQWRAFVVVTETLQNGTAIP